MNYNHIPERTIEEERLRLLKLFKDTADKINYSELVEESWTKLSLLRHILDILFSDLITREESLDVNTNEGIDTAAVNTEVPVVLGSGEERATGIEGYVRSSKGGAKYNRAGR